MYGKCQILNRHRTDKHTIQEQKGSEVEANTGQHEKNADKLIELSVADKKKYTCRKQYRT